MKKITEKLNKPWLIMLGMYLTALLAVLLPKLAEWPIVPVVFLALIPAFYKRAGEPDWWCFAAVLLGALAVQLPIWVF